jgi:hypothetical protein
MIRLVEGKAFMELDRSIPYREFGAIHDLSGSFMLEKTEDHVRVVQLVGSSVFRFGLSEKSLPEGFTFTWSLGQETPALQPLEGSQVLIGLAKEGLLSVQELGKYLKKAQSSWLRQRQLWSEAVTRVIASENTKTLSLAKKALQQQERQESTEKKFRELFRRRYFLPELD